MARKDYYIEGSDKMTDYLVKALAFNGEIRAMAVRTTDTVTEAQERHDTWRAATAALGRTLTGSLLLGAMHKNEEKLTVKIQGDGPLGAIVVDADSKGNVKGYVKNPEVNLAPNALGKIDVRGAVGANGTFSVVKDLGLKEPITGQVPIVSGEIAEDFTYYFATSEQVPSSVGLGVLVNPDNTVLAAGGFILKLMPGCEEEVIAFIEQRLNQIEPVSKMIEKGLTPEEIVQAVVGEDNVTILDRMPVAFTCQCSKERFSDAIAGLGNDEIQAMITEDGGAEAQCHFCLQTYDFSKEELEALLHD